MTKDSVHYKDALERVLQSPMFASAGRQRRFLKYVVEKTLEGETLKESLVGLEVYGRGPDYDPKIDSIVRVEAVRLRARLKEYYEGPGQRDVCRISLPKGGYSCVFELRELPEAPCDLPAAEPVPVPPPVSRARGRWPAAAVAACALALMGIASPTVSRFRLHSRNASVHAAVLPDFLEAHRLMRKQADGEPASETRGRLEKAVELFQRAAYEQPGSGRIHSGLAHSYLALADYDEGRFTELHGKAEIAAARSLKLDNSLDDAHHALGAARLFGRWDLAGALTEFTRAAEINPRRGHTHRLRADVLCMFGRFREALEALNNAETLEPTDMDIAGQKAAVFFRWRRYDEASAQARRALIIDPGNAFANFMLGLILQQQGRLDEAEEQFRRVARRPTRGPIALANLLAATGRMDAAIQLSRELNLESYAPTGWALIQIAAGNKTIAMQSLERAYRDRDFNLLYAATDPRFKALRDEPRFLAIFKRLNLPVMI